MFVHTLHFSGRAELGWAFEQLATSTHVEACLANLEKAEIRFVASAEHAMLW
jgi:hypothetical protein